jgi:hypothetical protein
METVGVFKLAMNSQCQWEMIQDSLGRIGIKMLLLKAAKTTMV